MKYPPRLQLLQCKAVGAKSLKSIQIKQFNECAKVYRKNMMPPYVVAQLKWDSSEECLRDIIVIITEEIWTINGFWMAHVIPRNERIKLFEGVVNLRGLFIEHNAHIMYLLSHSHRYSCFEHACKQHYSIVKYYFVPLLWPINLVLNQ